MPAVGKSWTATGCKRLEPIATAMTAARRSEFRMTQGPRKLFERVHEKHHMFVQTSSKSEHAHRHKLMDQGLDGQRPGSKCCRQRSIYVLPCRLRSLTPCMLAKPSSGRRWAGPCPQHLLCRNANVGTNSSLVPGSVVAGRLCRSTGPGRCLVLCQVLCSCRRGPSNVDV